MPTSALSCRAMTCNNCEHEELLKCYANDIVQFCVDVSCKFSIPMTSQKVINKSFTGWSEYVAQLLEESIFWHDLWADCGRPQTGVVADTMHCSRAACHCAICSIRKNESRHCQTAPCKFSA